MLTKRLLTTVLAGALIAAPVIPAAASEPGTDGTEIQGQPADTETAEAEASSGTDAHGRPWVIENPGDAENAVSYTVTADDGAYKIRYFTGWDDMAASIGASYADGTMTLRTDVTAAIWTAENTELDLDLNGYGITGCVVPEETEDDGTSDETYATIMNNGRLTVTDSEGSGKIDNSDDRYPAVANNDNGELYIMDGHIAKSEGDSCVAINYGTMEIGSPDSGTGVSVSCGPDTPAAIENGHFDSDGVGTASLTVYSGSITGGEINIINEERGILTICGGTFSDNADGCVSVQGAVGISGGTFTSSGDQVILFDDDTASVLTIAGGIFTAAGNTTDIFGPGSCTASVQGGTYIINGDGKVAAGTDVSFVTVRCGQFTTDAGLESLLAEGTVIEDPADGSAYFEVHTYGAADASGAGSICAYCGKETASVSGPAAEEPADGKSGADAEDHEPVSEEPAAEEHKWIEKTTAPTCSEDGFATYTCSICGEEYTEPGESALGHEWGEGTPDPAATCTEAGTTVYACTRCGETKSETVDALGHAWDEGTVTPATCTEDGYTTFKCTRCGEGYTETSESALGHEWGEGGITKEASSSEDGIKIFTCIRCGETYTETIPAAGTEEPDELQTDIDKSGLEEKILVANVLEENEYTSESWAIFANALSDAEATLRNDDATQEDIDAALASLSAAIDALEHVETDTEENGSDSSTEIPVTVEADTQESDETAAEGIYYAECGESADTDDELYNGLTPEEYAEIYGTIVDVPYEEEYEDSEIIDTVQTSDPSTMPAAAGVMASAAAAAVILVCARRKRV